MKCKRRKFHRNEFQTGDILSSLAPEQGLEACLRQLSRYLETREIKCLQKRLKEAEDKANERKEVIEQREEEIKESKEETKEVLQEKHDLEHKLETLVEDKDNSEQVSTQRQLEIDRLTQQIQTLEGEQEQNNRQTEEMKQEILALEDTLQQSKNILDHAGLKAIHNVVKKASDSFNEDSQFTIGVGNTADQELLKALQLFRLPPLKQFNLESISSFNEPKVITKFLGNALSENVKYFRFSTSTDSCRDLSPYMDTLTKTLPLIPSRVDLGYWTMTSSQFQDILVAAQKADYVKFYDCKIDVGEEMDFGGRLDQAAFTNINFESTGWSERSNWAQNGFEPFKNIVKGLAKVESIKNRQVSIHLYNCGMSKDQAESILQENGMTNMVVEEL